MNQDEGMTASDSQSERPNSEIARQVDDLLNSSDLADAVESNAFKRFLDHIPIAIVVSRLMGGEQRIVYANLCFETLSGQPPAAVEGQGWSILESLRHEDNSQLTLGQAVLEGDDFVGTFRRERPDVPPILVEAYVSRIENEDGTEDYRVAALVDVTARERSQREEFQRQVRDKDLLLKEIQHRVKNNLQLIVALIRLEARTARQDAKSIDFDRLAARIEAIHVLYRTLEGPAHGSDVDLGQYVGQIAAAAMGGYAVEQIRLDLQVEHCPVSVNIALPAGLLVNEAMTNAFKYAFAGRESGTITVRCLHEGDNYRLVVADDGIGLPSGSEWPAAGKLSALILQSLRENALATLRVESKADAGTKIEILLGLPVAKRH
jgi:PAS domain S-box-containing protein